MANAYSNLVVLVGLGRLVFRTFLLLRRLGQPVVVIERDENNPFLEGVRQDGSPLFVGDGRRDAVMREANVAGARSILLCTSDDLANLEMALDARSLAPGIHIVLRMFDPNLAEKIGKGLDIPVVISQSAISAPSFALRALDEDNLGSFTVQDELIVLRRVPVSELKSLAGATVADAMERWGVAVLERSPAHGQRELLPPPSTRFDPGDVLVLQGTEPRLARLFRSGG
jgi:voltage-gated potassium channel